MLLEGTAHGTFFAHAGNANTGTIDNLFASGRIAPLGPTLLDAGIAMSGFTASGAGGGNLVFESESVPGNLYLRLREITGPAAPTPGSFQFAYEITLGSGTFEDAHGSGTVVITLQPINTNIHGQPVSNPGFFGNATLTFQSGAGPLA
jgi:hypothetical protein